MFTMPPKVVATRAPCLCRPTRSRFTRGNSTHRFLRVTSRNGAGAPLFEKSTFCVCDVPIHRLLTTSGRIKASRGMSTVSCAFPYFPLILGAFGMMGHDRLIFAMIEPPWSGSIGGAPATGRDTSVGRCSLRQARPLLARCTFRVHKTTKSLRKKKKKKARRLRI